MYVLGFKSIEKLCSVYEVAFAEMLASSVGFYFVFFDSFINYSFSDHISPASLSEC